MLIFNHLWESQDLGAHCIHDTKRSHLHIFVRRCYRLWIPPLLPNRTVKVWHFQSLVQANDNSSQKIPVGSPPPLSTNANISISAITCSLDEHSVRTGVRTNTTPKPYFSIQCQGWLLGVYFPLAVIHTFYPHRREKYTPPWWGASLGPFLNHVHIHVFLALE